MASYSTVTVFYAVSTVPRYAERSNRATIQFVRHTSTREYEVGAKVLDSIPDAVNAHTRVDSGSMPRIIASGIALVKDKDSAGTPHSPFGDGSRRCLHCAACQQHLLCRAGSIWHTMKRSAAFPL